MRQCIDLTNQRFNRLVALEQLPGRPSRWLCQCDCGKQYPVFASNLRTQAVQSCGCYRDEKAKNERTTHGLRYHPLYRLWGSIKCRCQSNHPRIVYNYKQRGIKMCKQWEKNPQAFYDWAIANGWAPGLCIDRISHNKGYNPTNCRFVTYTENNNNKRTNIRVEYENNIYTIAQLCRKLKIVPAYRAYARIHALGWAPLEAVTHP